MKRTVDDGMGCTCCGEDEDRELLCESVFNAVRTHLPSDVIRKGQRYVDYHNDTDHSYRLKKKSYPLIHGLQNNI